MQMRKQVTELVGAELGAEFNNSNSYFNVVPTLHWIGGRFWMNSNQVSPWSSMRERVLGRTFLRPPSFTLHPRGLVPLNGVGEGRLSGEARERHPERVLWLTD